MRRASVGAGLGALLLAMACGAPPTGQLDDGCVDEACEGASDDGADGADDGDDGDDGADDGDDGADGGDDGADGVDDGDDGADDDGVDDGDDGSGGDGIGIPCDVREALAAACHECHSATPSFGAPMPLATIDDFHVPAPTDLTRPVHEVALERLGDAAAPMPPGGEIEPADSATLQAWLAAGAPEDADADCDDEPGPEPDPEGPAALPCEVDTVIAAHAPGGGKFEVPEFGADDLYQCFSFASPFGATTQATAWAPIIDDERVVHHWILYKTSEPHTHGAVYPCDVSLQLSADFVAGWAPGGAEIVMPDDVGLELGGPGTFYVLQVHYNNSAHYTDAADNSGVAFCTTDTPRPNSAGILTLGTIDIGIPPGAVGYETTGTCGWQTNQWPPLHVIGSSPHMHELGRGFYTEVDRQGGGTESLVSVPAFDFNAQHMYLLDEEMVIQPGDSLHTTCVYDNPTGSYVGFGEGTGDEMCFNFVLAYPIAELPSRNCGISIFG